MKRLLGIVDVYQDSADRLSVGVRVTSAEALLRPASSTAFGDCRLRRVVRVHVREKWPASGLDERVKRALDGVQLAQREGRLIVGCDFGFES
jgi:hypothetical protein